MQILKLEKQTELDVCVYAEEQGCLTIKLNLLGRVGWPDRLFLFKQGRMVFVEFKRVGEKPRKIQEYIHGKLRERGFNVEVVDNYADGRRIVDRLTQNG